MTSINKKQKKKCIGKIILGDHPQNIEKNLKKKGTSRCNSLIALPGNHFKKCRHVSQEHYLFLLRFVFANEKRVKKRYFLILDYGDEWVLLDADN